METSLLQLAEHRRRFVALLVGSGLLLAATGLSGCMSKREKAKKLLERRVEECRKAKGTWYKASILKGDEQTRILRQTCDEEMGTVQLTDEFTAKVEVGPYTWKAGIDEEMGAWVLQGVSWLALDRGLQRLDKSEPTAKELERGVEELAKAQEAYPKSAWIRLERLDGLVRLREKRREKTKESAVGLGERAKKQLTSTVEWAGDNDDPATAAKARLKAVQYVQDYIRSIEEAKSALGSQDDYYKKSIEEAEDAGNPEQAEKYRTELEEMKEKRPEKRELYDKLLGLADKRLCSHLSKLDAGDVEDDSVASRAKAAEERVDCDAIESGSENGDGEASDSGSDDE